MTYMKQNYKLGDIYLINFIHLNKKEIEMVRKWRNNKNIRIWMYNTHIIHLDEHIRFIRTLKNNYKDFYWLVKNEKEKKYIGVVYLNKVNFLHKNAYLGIYANPKMKDVGSTLIHCLKEVAFEIAKLRTLKLEVIETNKHAIQFYKKHGLKEEGRLKEFVYKDGKWLDVIVMGLTNKND